MAGQHSRRLGGVVLAGGRCRRQAGTAAFAHWSAPPEVAPLLAIALNEDAYRIDYPQRRGEYFDALWPHLNWEYAQLNIEASV
ncbi:hypothetical protein CUR86_12540 [Salinicola acroporae]|uniref:Manganese/iron superoxide dismutase C-terminal domain-containing protein n=1 Tax=Salinicola acroporae TaxID=1541440 RepID=A0ABT6I647_9GAMM|nr:hypothetical protein [Salinicola acroporae]